MRALRWLLGGVLVAWGLINVVPLVTAYGSKAGLVRLPPGYRQIAPLAHALHWWQALVWIGVILLYGLAGWRFIRGQRAFRILLLALVVELVRWVPMQELTLYRQVFTPFELDERYAAFALIAVVGAVIWWIEHGRGGGMARA